MWKWNQGQTSRRERRERKKVLILWDVTLEGKAGVFGRTLSEEKGGIASDGRESVEIPVGNCHRDYS